MNSRFTAMDVTPLERPHADGCPLFEAARQHYRDMVAQGRVETVPYEDADGSYLRYPPFVPTQAEAAQCNCGANSPWRLKIAVEVKHYLDDGICQ